MRKIKTAVCPVLICVLLVFVAPHTAPAGRHAAAAEAGKSSAVSVQLGGRSGEYNFSWRSYWGGPKLQLCEKRELKNGAFPSGAKVFSGEAVRKIDSRESIFHVTVKGLKAGREYAYRLMGNDGWEETRYFDTKNDKSGFNFLFIGDPQISGAESQAVFERGMDAAFGAFPDTVFVLSAGDQVDSSSRDMFEMFLSYPRFGSVPLMTVQGNHDDTALYPEYFFNPNRSELGSSGNGSGGDYYFVYGGALFLCLNMNGAYYGESASEMRARVDEHERFISETLAKVKAGWVFVMFHESIYSSGDERGWALRPILSAVFDKFPIDAVFQGHDHTQVRTYHMKGNEPRKNQMTETINGAEWTVDPDGILYLTGTGSADKHYEHINAEPEPYVAFRHSGHDTKSPCFTSAAITKNTFRLETYSVNAGGEAELIDEYGIYKSTAEENTGGCASAAGGVSGVFFVLCAAACIVIAKTRRRA